MWFDAHAKLAEITGGTPATPATTATQRAETPPRVAEVASVATHRAPASLAGRYSPNSPDSPLGGVLPDAPAPCSRDTPANAAFGGGRADEAELEEAAIDSFEERAAIREEEDGQDRETAEAAALHEVAADLMWSPDEVRSRWAADPDARRLALALRDDALSELEAATALGWDAYRTWAAVARLRAAGLATLGSDGRCRLKS